MANLIGSVSVTPAQVAPGQSVLVQVLDTSGKPYAAGSGVTVAIDGIPVNSRYYQFATAGTRTIGVYAAGNGQTETSTATVNVTGAPLQYHRTLFAAGEPAAPGQMPMIVLNQDLSLPYQANFALATPPAASAALAKAIAAAATAAAKAGKTPPAAVVQKAPAGFTALQALFPAAAAGQHLVVKEPVTAPPSTTSYFWTFGDGQTATTVTPIVSHDYFPAITPDRVPFGFDVSCHIVHDNITVTRTLVLYAAYGMCKRNGITVPHVQSDVYATLNGDRTSFSASLILYNIEDTAITVDQMAITPIWDDAAATYPAPAFKKMSQPVTIAAHSSSLLAVQVLRSDLESGAKGASVSGFIVAFQGTLASALPILKPEPIIPIAAPRPITPIVAPQPVTPIARPAAGAVLPAGGAVVAHPIVEPITISAGSTVRISRQVRLRLQDQQLPTLTIGILRPSGTVLQTLSGISAATGTIVRSSGIAVDPATNVVSVALSTPTPTPAQASQVRHSVLSVLNAPSTAGGTAP
jgi:hypothetical protein